MQRPSLDDPWRRVVCHLGRFATEAPSTQERQAVVPMTSSRWLRPLVVAAVLLTTSGMWSSPVSAIPPLCGGALVTIRITVPTGQLVQGTPGRDVILGSPGADNIDGGGGNDTICGKDGDDTIRGGDGTDIIFDGLGDDTVYGDAGDDYINSRPVGEPQPPDLGEAYGDDIMHGGAGNDTIYGGWGFDVVYGDAGNDTMLRGEQVIGGPGDDRLSVDSGFPLYVLDGGDGNDSLEGWAGDTIMYGGAGRDGFICGAGHDSIYGGADNDWFIWDYRDCEEATSVP
jgi:hypothetical protein